MKNEDSWKTDVKKPIHRGHPTGQNTRGKEEPTGSSFFLAVAGAGRFGIVPFPGGSAGPTGRKAEGSRQ
jgi:hypothetical protein